MDKKVVTFDELKQHNNSNSLWIAIYDKVYDVTNFSHEHPGGEEVLLEQAGRYATIAFEDMGHSSDARELMKKYEIGEMHEDSKESKRAKLKVETVLPKVQQSESTWLNWFIPLGVAVVVTYAYKYISSSSS